MATQRLFICVVGILFTWLVGSRCSVDGASFQNELLDRINALEKQGQQQTEKMLAMESRLEEQDRRLSVQETTISDYKQRVADLEQTVAELKLKQDPDVAEVPVESNAGTTENHGIVRPEGSVQSAYMNASGRQRRALLNAEGPVAFHALIGGGEVLHIGANQKIVFPTVMTNLGGGYRNQHGIFTAPQPGIYIFSVSILSDNRNHVEIDVQLMKNGNQIGRAYAHGDSGRHDQGSVTVVTQLAAGDEVWVSLWGPADTSLYGGNADSFMGCLVYPL